MQVTTEKITPTIAAGYLETFNTANRPLKDLHVKALAADMAAGRWMLTHEGIAFASDGTLIDGQHRLAAIVASGVTMDILVARGCDRETFQVIGVGSARSASDVLAISGEKFTSRMAAVVTAAVLGVTGRAITKPEIMEFMRGPYGPLVRSIVHTSPQIIAAVAGAAVKGVVTGNISAEFAVDLCRRFVVGDWSGANDPICRLKRAVTERRVTRIDQYRYAVRAIAGARDRERMEKLYRATKDWGE